MIRSLQACRCFAALLVVLHHTSRSDQAKTLPDWRGTLPLPEPLGRGESVGLNLSLQDVDVAKPLGHIDWHGYSAAALFTGPKCFAPDRVLASLRPRCRGIGSDCTRCRLDAAMAPEPPPGASSTIGSLR